MKAEEYLKENRFESLECSGYDVCYNDALEAVKMAREEDKERAFKVLEFILDEWVHGGDAECILEEFKEKLNYGKPI